MAYSLDGCLAKIERAKEHHESLKTYVDEFLKSANKSLTQSSHHSDDGLKVILRATCPLEPSLNISVITGEIVHQLRSTLDHLLCALIIQSGQTPSSKSQFPICTTRENYVAQVKGGRIKGVSPTAEQLIEKIQPYTSPNPNTTVNYVISTLNNWDKHKALIISTAAAGVGKDLEIIGKDEKSNAQVINLSAPEIIKFENGKADYFYIQLAAPSPGLTAKSSIELYMAIVFNEDGEIADLVDLMRQLIADVERTVKLFEEELN